MNDVFFAGVDGQMSGRHRQEMAQLHYRKAVSSDVPAIIALLADDVLGTTREQVGPAVDARYESAFAEIDADANQYLCVVEYGDAIVGTLQLTFIRGLSRTGALRGQVEAVRVAADRRSERIGEAMFRWAIEECRARGCSIVHLTTDRSRSDAHRFYDRLGFRDTHLGYKLTLETPL